MTMNRTQLVELLQEYINHQPDILTAWEAGSAATNTLDSYSDLDVLCITSDEKVESTLQDLLSFIRSSCKVEQEYRLPEPTWHGFSQVFLSFTDAENYVYLDLSVTKQSNPDLFTDQERHGIAKIWKDDINIYHEKHTSSQQIDTIRERIKNSLSLDFVIILELKKALARKNEIDIQTNLMTFLQRFYAPVFNLKYRPAKADFGLRYINRDWPNEAVQKVIELFKGTLQERNDKIFQIIADYNKEKKTIQ